MTFSQQYITFLRVLEEVGMTSIEPINYQGMEIQPLQFLKAVLPEPSSLGPNYQGQTSIGCQIRGVKDGKERTLFIFNNCSHQMAYRMPKPRLSPIPPEFLPLLGPVWLHEGFGRKGVYGTWSSSIPIRSLPNWDHSACPGKS